MTIKIGMVGLGSIAQKAWLPVLGRTESWQLVGAFSPNQQKAQPVCDSYRIACYNRLDMLAADCDAVFVHSSTASHYEVVKTLLLAGVDVCVDKPLAQSLSQAEELVELAHRRGRTLMVAFNRRFAPRYQQLKAALNDLASLRMDKHRSDSIGPQDLHFTLLDDYLHLLDTLIWLAGGQVTLHNGVLLTNDEGEMRYAEHHLSAGKAQLTASMHRRAGSQRETVLAVSDGAITEVSEMREWRQERNGQLQIEPVASWQSLLAQRGFEGAAHHFIHCVQNQTMPETSGAQALLAQRLVEKIWRDHICE